MIDLSSAVVRGEPAVTGDILPSHQESPISDQRIILNLDTNQPLKLKYGDGYSLLVRAAAQARGRVEEASCIFDYLE